MCTYLIKKFNKSVTLFLSIENITFFGHVKIFQNLDWKNLTLDPNKERLPWHIDTACELTYHWVCTVLA